MGSSSGGDKEAQLLKARDAFSGTRVETPVETILATGQSRRHRRRQVQLSAAVAASGALAPGLGLGLAIVVSSGSPVPAPQTIRTAPFTLARNANGTVSLTLNQDQVLDPAAMPAGTEVSFTTGTTTTTSPEASSTRPHLHGRAHLQLHPSGRTPRQGSPLATPPRPDPRRPGQARNRAECRPPLPKLTLPGDGRPLREQPGGPAVLAYLLLFLMIAG
jgi:hypothetical protein